MKKMFFAIIALVCLSIPTFAQNLVNPPMTDPLDASGHRAEKLRFVGITSVELQVAANGDLLMQVMVEYDNKYGADIVVSDVIAKTLVMDSTFKEDVFSLVYHDICEDGCQLRELYKYYECGVFQVPVTAVRQSIVFKKGLNTTALNFRIGNLIATSLNATGIEGLNESTHVVANKAILQRLIRISNAMNGQQKNNARLMLVMEGIGNYLGSNSAFSTTVVIGKVQLASAFARKEVPYIFQGKIIE